MYDALVKKQANLFIECDALNVMVPQKFDDLNDAYILLMKRNNENDLHSKQNCAKERLRYHKIKELMEAADYENMILQQQSAAQQLAIIEDAYNQEKDKIDGNDGILNKIYMYRRQISQLQARTVSEELLVRKINRKLKHMVSFEMIHCAVEEGRGYYQIKSLITNEVRSVTQLSTGEKNIIAFLYFLEKVNEIGEEGERKNKIIVFDDPMNSNDDNMQYLIIEELQKLMKSISSEDTFILLTHNIHFYLNVKYGVKYEKSIHIHMHTNGIHTIINYISNDESDFKTSYESLWNEMKFLYYNENVAAEMLMNPIRRIIETYTRFNCMSVKQFCEETIGAKKLFDVNSHSIDDLEADLNGKTKREVVLLMRMCFENNKAGAHFDTYWPDFIEEIESV